MAAVRSGGPCQDIFRRIGTLVCYAGLAVTVLLLGSAIVKAANQSGKASTTAAPTQTSEFPAWSQTSAGPLETTVTMTTTSTTTTFPRPVCPSSAKRFGPRLGDFAAAQAGNTELTEDGCYDLRVLKGGRLVGCAAPVNLFPGNKKYGCSGEFGTAETCDAAPHPVKHTAYVWSVHDACMTMNGKGTYGYAYDDGIGLKQCSPLSKYEWILCPEGSEQGIAWAAEPGHVKDSTRRFRVTNKCQQPVWIQQAGDLSARLEGEEEVLKMDPGTSHTYSIPNRGVASTRFLPKTGCDATGNACDVQSMPPCPPQGCDLPVDTKFEASWGCVYAKGTRDDRHHCALTGQGNPATYQDWWDGSAVDGWTLPFSVLTDDGGQGLTAGSIGSPETCGDVICAKLDPTNYCPTDEFLTP